MASKRVITSDTWQDEFIGSLNFMQRLLWIGMFSRCADDQGRMVDNAVVIRSLVFPYDDIPVSEIEDALSLFSNDNKVIRYTIDGKKYIQIANWWTHQQGQWAMPSKHPAPEGWNDQIRAFIKGSYIEINWPKKMAKPVDTPTDEPIQEVHLDNPPGQSTLGVGVAGHNHEINLNHINNNNGSGTRPEIFSLYEKEIGSLTGRIGEFLIDAEKRYPQEWIRYAFDAAIRANVRKWNYIDGVLKRIEVEGFQPNKPFEKSNGKPKTKTQQIADNNRDVLRRALEKGVNDDNAG